MRRIADRYHNQLDDEDAGIANYNNTALLSSVEPGRIDLKGPAIREWSR
jgi:hypothetical protein